MAYIKLLLSIVVAAQVTSGKINKKFVSNTASASLLCNTCAWIADNLNHSLFKADDFEVNVGFRLNSEGKKIRKNSQWLKLVYALCRLTIEASPQMNNHH